MADSDNARAALPGDLAAEMAAELAKLESQETEEPAELKSGEKSGPAEPVPGEAARVPPKVCSLRRRALPAKTKGRVKGKSFACRHCLTLQTLLYRNVGPGVLQRLSSLEKQRFYARSVEKAPDSRYAWQTVRSGLVSRMVAAKLEEKEYKVQAEELPLKVWLQRGWEEESS